MKEWIYRSIAAMVVLMLSSSAIFAQSGDRIAAEKAFVEAQKALASGDDQAAEQSLMKSLRFDPAFTSAVWQLSQIYERRGKLEYARELLLRGLKQEPQAAWARDKLDQMEKTLTRKLLSEAESHMGAGKYDLAVPKLSLYLGIKPHDPLPLEMLGRCHLALGNLKMADEYLRQAMERDPSNGDLASLLDEVESRMSCSRADAAIDRARTILADYSPEDRKNAEEALREVLNLDPENEWAAEKLNELALIDADNDTKDEKEQAAGTEEKGFRGMKTMENPMPRAFSILKSNISILLLAAAAVLLVLNLRRRTRIKNYPLQGSLNLIPVLDIVSLLNSNLKTGRLAVMTGKNRGEIYFEKGEIVHSRFRSFDGKSAFHKIMESQTGDYIFYNHLPNVKHTISEPLSLLLLSMRTDEQPRSSKKTRPAREKVGV